MQPDLTPPGEAAPQDAGPELRERILKTATRLFAERGFAATSVRELVEAAGCTKPVLYYYFGSKEGLFLEAVRTHMGSYTALLEDVLARAGTVRERLIGYVESLVAVIEAQPDALRFLMTAQHHSERGQPRLDLLSLHRQNTSLLKQLVNQGVETGEIRGDIDLLDAALALAGIVNTRAAGGLFGMPMPRDLATRLIDLYFKGVSK